MEVSGQLQAPAALLMGKQPPVQEKLDRLQIRCNCYGEDNHIFRFQGIELRFLVRPAGSQSLYRQHEKSVNKESHVEGRASYRNREVCQNLRINQA
jgi:hypothetical protein